jgi:hypothetical protein
MRDTISYTKGENQGHNAIARIKENEIFTLIGLEHLTLNLYPHAK